MLEQVSLNKYPQMNHQKRTDLVREIKQPTKTCQLPEQNAYANFRQLLHVSMCVTHIILLLKSSDFEVYFPDLFCT